MFDHTTSDLTLIHDNQFHTKFGQMFDFLVGMGARDDLKPGVCCTGLFNEIAGLRGRISERPWRPELTTVPLQSRPNASALGRGNDRERFALRAIFVYKGTWIRLVRMLGEAAGGGGAGGAVCRRGCRASGRARLRRRRSRRSLDRA